MHLRIDHAQPDDASIVAQIVGKLLREIMELVETKAFGFHQEETEARARSWITDGKYSVLLARDEVQPEPLGFWRSMKVLLSIRRAHMARFQNSMSVRLTDRSGWGRR